MKPENDVIGVFATDEERNQLKEAILECTREEVQRTLFDLLAKHSSYEGVYLSSLRQQTGCLHAVKKELACRSGFKPIHQTSSSSAEILESSLLFRPKQSSRHLSSRHTHVPLDIEVKRSSKLELSTSGLLEKSIDIVTRATGRCPRKFDLFCDDKGTKNCNGESASRDLLGNYDRLQRVVSQHVRTQRKPRILICPTKTTRLARTLSRSIAQPNPIRPSTTALERRKPQLSTIASERSKAQEIGKRLLGPITLDTKRQNYAMVLPNSLQFHDWENELARNIISVFSNKVRSDIKQNNEPVDNILPVKSAVRSVTSDALFHNGGDESGRGSQKITISRGRFFNIGENDKELSDTADKISSCRIPQTALVRQKGIEPNGTLRVKMIWMTGTGMVRPNWQTFNGEQKTKILFLLNASMPIIYALHIDQMSVLENGFSIDCDELFTLEEQGRYTKYIRIVESVIAQWNHNIKREEYSGITRRMWRQLVISSNAFATRSIEKRKYAGAMELLEKSMSLIESEIGLLTETIRDELTAMTKDTYAYYYIRRSKPSASLQYVLSAINIYKTSVNPFRFFNIAKCHLHEAFIYCMHNKYAQSMKSLRKILSMVENGSLDTHSDNKEQVMLLISITYHNIAVQQLMTGHFSDACVSSQNARRLARLCLSVSSHYLPMLESTHKQSMNQLVLALKNSSVQGHQKHQANLFHGLINELYE